MFGVLGFCVTAFVKAEAVSSRLTGIFELCLAFLFLSCLLLRKLKLIHLNGRVLFDLSMA